MKYELIYGVDNNELSERVTTYLEAGWELYGQPIIQDRSCAYQAVIKK